MSVGRRGDESARHEGRILILRDDSERKQSDKLGNVHGIRCTVADRSDSEFGIPLADFPEGRMEPDQFRRDDLRRANSDESDIRFSIQLIADGSNAFLPKPASPGTNPPDGAADTPPAYFSAGNRCTRLIDQFPGGNGDSDTTRGEALLCSTLFVVDDQDQRYSGATHIGMRQLANASRLNSGMGNLAGEEAIGGSISAGEQLGAGEGIPAGLNWDGGRIGAWWTVFRNAEHDKFADGKRGSAICITGINTDAHFESVTSANDHGAIFFRITPDLSRVSEAPVNTLLVKESLAKDTSVANLDSTIGKESVKWRPWSPLPGSCGIPEDGQLGGPDDGIPGSPPSGGGGTLPMPPDPVRGGVLAIPITFVGLGPDYVIVGPVGGWQAGATGYRNDSTSPNGAAVAAILGQVQGGTTYTDSWTTAPRLIVGTRNSYAGTTTSNQIRFGGRSGPAITSGSNNTRMTFTGWGNTDIISNVTIVGNQEVSGNQTIFGDVSITGKVTADGGIDPVYLELSDGTGTMHAADYAALAPVARARLRYNDVTRSLQTSIDAQPYADLVGGQRRQDGEMLEFAVAMACQQAAMAGLLGVEV